MAGFTLAGPLGFASLPWMLSDSISKELSSLAGLCGFSQAVGSFIVTPCSPETFVSHESPRDKATFSAPPMSNAVSSCLEKDSSSALLEESVWLTKAVPAEKSTWRCVLVTGPDSREGRMDFNWGLGRISRVVLLCGWEFCCSYLTIWALWISLSPLVCFWIISSSYFPSLPFLMQTCAEAQWEPIQKSMGKEIVPARMSYVCEPRVTKSRNALCWCTSLMSSEWQLEGAHQV